jgi:hypothetical protein
MSPIVTNVTVRKKEHLKEKGVVGEARPSYTKW